MADDEDTQVVSAITDCWKRVIEKEASIFM